MAYLPETPEWTTGVYQLEKSDPVRGGVDGPANKPLIDLLKRTAWLKQRYEEAFSGLGWTELGEWAVGLEVTTPSQIVHYQGYWYRYGGSLPHTITGASPSLDDNGNWFNLGNDVSLRANLGSSEGFSLVGKCPNISTLRAIEPSYNGQSIILERAATGAATVNAILTHDPTDTTSPDDGISIFVTPGGARWKADISQGYDLRLAGLLVDGSNFSPVLKKARDAIINKVVANGRVNNIASIIKIVPTNFICEFKITEKVDLPPFISCGTIGGPYFEAGDFLDDYSFRISNQDFPQLTKAMYQAETSWKGATSKYWNQAVGNKPFFAMDGQRMTLRGPGYALDSSGNPTIKTVGIVFGNDVPCELDVRNLMICDMKITGFHTSHRWGTYYTFMCGFRDCYFSRCYNGMEVPESFYNFGEDMQYQHCVFGNIENDAFWIKGGGEFTLDGGTDVDFVGRHMLHIGPLSPVEFKYVSGHIEGIQGRTVFKDAPQSYSQSTVLIGKAVKRDVRRTLAGLSSEYYGIYQEYECPSSIYGQSLKVTDESYTSGRAGIKPCTPYPTLAGPPSNTGVYLKTPRGIDLRTPFPNSYSDACSNRINRVLGFTELSTGDVGGDLLSTDYAWAALKTGNAKCRYGTMADADPDGYMPFIIELTDPSEVVQLFCTNEAKAGTSLELMWGTASIRIADAVGDVMVSVVMACYLRNSIRVTQDPDTKVFSATSTPIRRTFSESAKINMTTQRQGMPITSADYQAMLPQAASNYWQGNDFIQAGLKFTNFVGKIYVTRPYWYLP
ncbi:hypothetical protein ACYCAP_18000 [Klebsiella pneumoniae]